MLQTEQTGPGRRGGVGSLFCRSANAMVLTFQNGHTSRGGAVGLVEGWVIRQSQPISVVARGVNPVGSFHFVCDRLTKTWGAPDNGRKVMWVRQQPHSMNGLHPSWWGTETMKKLSGQHKVALST